MKGLLNVETMAREREIAVQQNANQVPASVSGSMNGRYGRSSAVAEVLTVAPMSIQSCRSPLIEQAEFVADLGDTRSVRFAGRPVRGGCHRRGCDPAGVRPATLAEGRLYCPSGGQVVAQGVVMTAMVTVDVAADDVSRLAWAVQLALGHEEQLALKLGGRHVAEAREYDRLAAWLDVLRKEVRAGEELDDQG